MRRLSTVWDKKELLLACFFFYPFGFICRRTVVLVRKPADEGITYTTEEVFLEVKLARPGTVFLDRLENLIMIC